MKRKIIFLIVVIGFIFSFSSCKKLLTFKISDSTTTTVGKNIPLLSAFNIPTPDITTNSESEFEKNNTNVDLVKEILLKKLKLTITSPSDKTFSFLKSIEVYISADGEDEIKVAWNNNVESTAQSIELELTEKPLDNYVKKDKYTLRTTVITREALSQSVDIRIDETFQVTADPL
jgi:hypothetical protein